MSTQTAFSAEGVSTNEPEEQQQETTHQESNSPASPESAFANQLAEIRNERGEPKYKDLPTALEALKHSQEYIPSLKSEKEQLEQRLAEMQEELTKRKSVEEIMDRLQPSSSQQEQQTEQPQAQTGSLTQEEVMSLLEQYVPNFISKHQEQTQAQQNILNVDKSLKEAYGDNANKVVQTKAQELGVTPQELEQLAAKSPQMVLSLFEIKPQSKIKTTTSSVNIPPTRQQQPELEKPERSLLSGATSKQQAEYMAKVKERVYARHGVQS